MRLCDKRPDSCTQGPALGWIGARCNLLARFAEATSEGSSMQLVEEAIGGLVEATSPQLLVEQLEHIGKLVLRHFGVRLTGVPLDALCGPIFQC